MSAFTARHAGVTYEPDAWPGRVARFGLIVLSVDHATEAEMRRIVPSSVADFHVDRIPMPSPCTIDNLARLGPEIRDAAARLLPGSSLDAVIFACTSGAIVVGTQRVAEEIRVPRPGVPVITPMAAALDACGTLGVNRLSVLTPYLDEVNARIHDHLTGHGVEVARFDSFHLAEDREMSAVPPAAIRDAALAADDPRADALFICCTALRPSSIIDELEQHLGKPVITSHQASAWAALRASGRTVPPIDGQGRLLREHC